MSLAPAQDDKARLRLWVRLLRVSRRIEGQLRERLAARFDTTLPRFDVMAALARAPDGMMMSEVSRYLLVSNGNVTGIIGRLAREGLVLRGHREGDRRTSIVRLSPSGRAAFAAMAEAHAEWIEELFGDIAPDDAGRMAAILTSSFRSRGEDEH